MNILTLMVASVIRDIGHGGEDLEMTSFSTAASDGVIRTKKVL